MLVIVVSGLEAIGIRLEAIAIRLEAIAIRLEAIAIGWEAIAIRWEVRIVNLFTSFPSPNMCAKQPKKRPAQSPCRTGLGSSPQAD